MRNNIFNTLTLFASMSTLVCCALPALLVTLGLGASLAGLVSNVPSLIWLSEHKTGLFIFSGVMLSAAAFMQYRSRYAGCPSDPMKARACRKTRTLSKYIFRVSLITYLIGFFFAYMANYLFA